MLSASFLGSVCIILHYQGTYDFFYLFFITDPLNTSAIRCQFFQQHDIQSPIFSPLYAPHWSNSLPALPGPFSFFSWRCLRSSVHKGEQFPALRLVLTSRGLCTNHCCQGHPHSLAQLDFLITETQVLSHSEKAKGFL